MNTVTILCNILLFGFTCLVLVTDGAPNDPVYIVFTVLLLLIPVVTVFAIARRKADDSSMTAIRGFVAICNVILLGFVCWALVDQYPHPEEEGFLAFAVLTVLTPLLSAVMLFRGAFRHARRAA